MSEDHLMGVDGTDDVWFRDHIRAAREIGTFCRDAGIGLEDLNLADVGTGDGIIAMGVTQEAAPASLVAFDVNPVDSDALLRRARHVGYCDELPPGLRFEVSGPKDLPAPSNSFDGVLSWSAFEHIQDIQAVAMEISRVLRPNGVFFLQIWPLFHSKHGGISGSARLTSPSRTCDSPTVRSRHESARTRERTPASEQVMNGRASTRHRLMTSNGHSWCRASFRHESN